MKRGPAGVNLALNLRLDTSAFDRGLRGFEKQIPYAIAVALTRTAKDARAFVAERLSDHFVIRGPFITRGVRYDPARKTSLRATVGSVDAFMEAQAVGGIKHARGGREIGIPLVGRGQPRPTLKSVTRPAKWPGAYLRKGTGFLREVGGLRGIWSSKTGRLLYALRRSVKIPARWPLEAEVLSVVADKWATHTASALEHALKTAK